MYRERPSAVAGAVVWEVRVEAVDGIVTPDGCMDLIANDGVLFIAGPDTGPHRRRAHVGARFVGLRLPPGVGPAVFGVPAHALRDQRVPLEQVWSGGEARQVAESLDAASSPGAALEATARRRLISAPAPPLAAAVADLAQRNLAVREIAATVGFSERQLHRHCLDAFGYGPKTLVRILRMRRALRMARGATTFADVAAATGYADQAHLARDVRALTGATLGESLR